MSTATSRGVISSSDTIASVHHLADPRFIALRARAFSMSLEGFGVHGERPRPRRPVAHFNLKCLPKGIGRPYRAMRWLATKHGLFRSASRAGLCESLVVRLDVTGYWPLGYYWRTYRAGHFVYIWYV